jgi:hypothetical protein
MEGHHWHGPHFPPQEVVDLDPNALPPIAAKTPIILYGVANRVSLSKYGRREHYLRYTDGTHYDHYGFRAITSALAGTRLQSDYEIVAKHSGDAGRSAEFEQFACGSNWTTGTTVSFDASRGTLSFAIANIDILDGRGGASGAVDPEFAGDPVVSGRLTIASLSLQGHDPDGAYRFAGGEVALADPSGHFDVTGRIGTYRIRETTGGTQLTSFGLFDSLEVSDVVEESLGPSHFLVRFVDVDFLGKGLGQDEWLQQAGLGLAFLTPQDLVAATAGFTHSATLPATVLIAATRFPPPAVPAAGVAGLALMFLLTAGLAVGVMQLRKRGATPGRT